MSVNPSLGWKDIRNESYRAYHFYKDGDLVTIKIDKPFAVAISKNGHRVFNKQGISYYIPNGWIVLSWEGLKKGEPQYDW